MLRNLLFKIEDLLGLSPQYSSNTAFLFGREFPRQAIIAIPALALLGVLTYFAFSDTSASAQPAPPMVVATLPAESTKATTALGAAGLTTPVNALPSATATVAGSTTPAPGGTTPAGAQAPASTGGATTPTPRPTTAAAPTQPPAAPAATEPTVAPVFEPTQAPVAPVVPTNTPLPLDTATPIPTNTLVPTPTRTATPVPKIDPKLTLDPSSYTIGGSADARASISGYPANELLTIKSAITAQSFPRSVLDLINESDELPLTIDGKEGSPQAKTNAQGGGDEITAEIAITKSMVCDFVEGIEDSSDFTAEQKAAIIEGLWGQSITVKVTVYAGGKSASDTFKLNTPSRNLC